MGGWIGLSVSPIWPLSSPVNMVMSLDFSDSQSSLQDKDGKTCHATRGVQRSRHSAEHTAGSEHALEREDAAAGDDVLTGVHPYGSPGPFPMQRVCTHVSCITEM